MLHVVSNSALIEKEEQEAQEKRALDERQNSPTILGLAAYLRTCWNAAHQSKMPIQQKMLRALRQRNGEYEADKLSNIQKYGGSEVYMLITETKCRSGEGWMRDILLDTGTPPWDLQPTPLPDLSPEQMEEVKGIFSEKVMQVIQESGEAMDAEGMMTLQAMITQQYRFKILQEAQNRADKMKMKISDQFAQGGWANAFNDFITDLVTFPCAFIKGPIVRRQKKLGWTKGENGATTLEATEELAPEFERVDPFRVYPEPGITNVTDGYIFVHHEMTSADLSEMIGVPGYDDAAIRMALQTGNTSSWISPQYEHQKDEEERKYYAYFRPTDMFDVLEFWGKVSGKMLVEWGMSEEDVPDQERHYDANVWVVGNYIIKAVLNYDPLGEKPFVKTSFIKCAGAFWGKGIPEIIEDIQMICNAAARSLVNNMGISSGPQAEVNIERIPPGEQITQIHPWKIWQVTNDPLGSSAPAIRFMQPESNSKELMEVYDRFSKLADDHSGIPSYLSGDLDVQGAGRTASGLSMLMGAAGKGIRQVIMHIDNDIIKPIIQRQFLYNMRFDDDESIKGDVEVLPRGAVNLAVRETVNLRRIEFLNATANEIDSPIIGKEGRAALLREVAKSLQMPVDEIVPSREKLEYQKKAEADVALASAAGAGGGGGSPALPAPTFPGGEPKGGQQANTVAPRGAGQ